MAVKATLPTNYGEERELYVRLNNLEEAQNHGLPTIARFRGYVSKEAFDARAGFVWEREVAFMADVSLPLWDQAYAALKNMAPIIPPDPPADPGAYVEDPDHKAKFEAALAGQVEPAPPAKATAQELRAHDALVKQIQAKRQTIRDVYAKDEAARKAAHETKIQEHAIAVREHDGRALEIDRLNAQAAALKQAKDV